MRNRAVIYSESDCDSMRSRRRDSDEIIIKKREKTLEQLEEENEDKISSQMLNLNNYYNYGAHGTEAPLKELIIELIKETIISKDKNTALFKEMKKAKRRNSQSLTQELSDKTILDKVILSDDTKAKQKHDSGKSSSTKFSSCFEDNSAKSIIEPAFNNTNASYPCVREAIAQNTNLEDKIKLMFVSNESNFIIKSLILYILNEDWASESPMFTIKNKLFQFTNNKTLMLSIYNTQLALHSNPFCKVYYPLMDSIIYFIDNTQEIENSFTELSTFIKGISSLRKSLLFALIVNSDTPIELIERIKTINYPITVYDINDTNDFNKIALRKTIMSIMLRRPIKHKQETEEDDYFGCFDDLNCESGYKIEDKDEEEEEQDNNNKFSRCKSYAF